MSQHANANCDRFGAIGSVHGNDTALEAE